MLYFIEKAATPLENLCISQYTSALIVGCLSRNDFMRFLEHNDYSQNCVHDFLEQKSVLHHAFLNYEQDSFGIMPILDTSQPTGKRDLIGIYLRANCFIIVDLEDRDQSTRHAFEEALAYAERTQTSLSHFVYHFLRALTADYPMLFPRIQESIEAIDHDILDGVRKHIDERLSQINHEILQLYQYYEELADFSVTLSENDNHFFEKKDLSYFLLFAQRCEHYSSNMTLLRDYLAQVRGLYQAKLDTDMNQTMKILTIVTAIFAPLTLLVGWYGMNFRYMPELEWPYAYPVIIAICPIITVSLVWFFRKKRLL